MIKKWLTNLLRKSLDREHLVYRENELTHCAVVHSIFPPPLGTYLQSIGTITEITLSKTGCYLITVKPL